MILLISVISAGFLCTKSLQFTSYNDAKKKITAVAVHVYERGRWRWSDWSELLGKLLELNHSLQLW